MSSSTCEQIKIVEGPELDAFVEKLRHRIEMSSSQEPQFVNPAKQECRFGALPTMALTEKQAKFMAKLEKACAGRRRIRVSANEHNDNIQIARGLSADERIFQRGGSLVFVERSRSTRQCAVRAISRGLLRDLISKTCFFYMIDGKDEVSSRKFVEKRPPAANVNSVHELGQWDDIPPLRAVARCPLLRPDGTLLNSPGWDEETEIFLPPECVVPHLRDDVTLVDAKRAVDLLVDIVRDFPFKDGSDRSAWLCGLLTLVVRHAIPDNVPLFLITANIRGSGKSLLADVIGIIATGVRMPRTVAPRDDDEFRKRITSAVLAADQAQLLDNLDGVIGFPSLDAAITGRYWKDRILGKSDQQTFPMDIVWYATGNNLAIRGDLSRRIVPIRLLSEEEQPEERTGFKHPNLIQHVGVHRQELVAAALTILRAYIVAGKPSQNMPSFGSFEEWSDLVRSAVVWVGQPDPMANIRTVVDDSDTDRSALDVILSSLPELTPEGKGGLTSKEIIALATPNSSDAASAMQEALAEICRRPDNTREVGQRLRNLKGRRVQGRSLTSYKGSKSLTYWRVQIHGDKKAEVASEASPVFEHEGKQPQSDDQYCVQPGENDIRVASEASDTSISTPTRKNLETCDTERHGDVAAQRERPGGKPLKQSKQPLEDENGSAGDVSTLSSRSNVSKAQSRPQGIGNIASGTPRRPANDPHGRATARDSGTDAPSDEDEGGDYVRI